MSVLRSQPMGYYQIAMSRESAWDVLNEIGNESCIQLVDMNKEESYINRQFSKDIKRCEDLEYKLNFIENYLKKEGLKIKKCNDFKNYLLYLNELMGSRQKSEHTYIDDLETQISQKYKSLQEQIKSVENLVNKQKQLFEYKTILMKSKEVFFTNDFLQGKNIMQFSIQDEMEEDEKKDQEDKQTQSLDQNLGFIAGVVNSIEALKLKRMIFRATKGNNWIQTSDLPREKSQEPEQDVKEKEKQQQEEEDEDEEEEDKPKKQEVEEERRTVILVLFPASQQDTLKQKLVKIFDSFEANRYGVPSQRNQFNKKIIEIDTQIIEIKGMIQLTNKGIQQLLVEWIIEREGSGCSFIEEIRLYLIKEKSILFQMNMLTIKNVIYSGYFWCPLLEIDKVKKCMSDLSRKKPELPPASIHQQDFPKFPSPPTFIKVNEVTAPFQEIVNTYGIPRYGEVNPGLFAIAMFPFKFGIMFGDIGHGGVVFAIGLLLCLNKEKLANVVDKSILQIRYLLLLMGGFAFYAGLIYNDFFSLTTNLFGSCWVSQPDGTASHKDNCVYPIGMDPKWFLASNELIFFNSFKMKFAVIFGVTQMLFGIVMKAVNCIHFGQTIELLFEFIPQILFMLSTFGYMNFLILFKWSNNYMNNTSQAPSIITQMINLPLKAGSAGDYPLWERSSQESIQLTLLIISLLCVPVMLLVKPIILWVQHANEGEQNKHNQYNELSDLHNSQDLEHTIKEKQQIAHHTIKPVESAQGHGGHGEEEFDFGEIFVHQIIETIEFILGSISNTASYLRLWALSLAHSQLSKVFFTKTLGGGIQTGNPIMIFIGWVLFFNITLGVIMAMDMMECFLHALRLQWVEFQSKFYKADGYRFVPFSFIISLSEKSTASK